MEMIRPSPQRSEAGGELRVSAGLILGAIRIDGETLGLDDGQWPVARIFQHVIGAAIGSSLLGGDLRFVLNISISFTQQAVDDDPGAGFV
jgi:hypothetical protein